jgi:hypothetical protein
MTATSSKTNTAIPDRDAATERAGQVNDRLAAVGREVATAYLDGIEKYVADFAKLERKLGEQANVDAVGNLFTAHAQLTEHVAKASISAARELITA